MKPIPPNILTSRTVPAPERAARTIAAVSSWAAMRQPVRFKQHRQLIQSPTPAVGMAHDSVGPRKLLVADEELGAAAIRRDGHRYLGFDACMLVWRLYDPRKDDLRRGLDRSVSTADDDGLSPWQMI